MDHFDIPDHILTIHYHDNRSGEEKELSGNFGTTDRAIQALEEMIAFLKGRK